MAELTPQQKRAVALSRSKQTQGAPAGSAGDRTPEQRRTRIAELEAELAELAPVTGGDVGRAALTAGTAALAEPVSGIAGLAGLIAGAIPGGESPSEKGARFVEGTREALTVAPGTPGAERILEGVGIAGEAAAQIARVPVAGLAGIAQLPFGGVEGATETIRRTREEGIGPTAGRSLQDLGAPPAIAALAETIPIGLATIAGVRNPFRRGAPEVPPTRTTTPSELPPVSVGRPSLDEPVDLTPPEGFPRFEEPTVAKQAAAAQAAPDGAIPADADAGAFARELQKKKVEDLARRAAPDPEVLASAERLGVDLNPEHYATDIEFQSVARQFKSQAPSPLAAAEVRAIEELAQKSDELVVELGGSIDKGALSEDLVQNTRSTIAQLGDQADALYSQVREAIVPQTRVQMDGIAAHLEQQLADLGGDAKLLTAAEKKLASAVKNAGEEGMTYAALDRIRRDVGEGFNKNRGPFKDNDTRVLREIYAVLSEAQQGVAEAAGIGEIYTAARGLVAKRKGVEDDAVALFGKDLETTIVQKLKTAATGISKGDVTAFNRLMEPLSEVRRSEVAATVLSDLFTATSRGTGQATPAFGKVWEGLNRSPTAKRALFRHFPEGAEQRFDDIGRSFLAIEKSNRKAPANPSGTAAAVVTAIENGSLFRRLAGAGARAVGGAAATTAGGPAGGAIANLLMRRSGTSGPTNFAQQVMTSPELKGALKAAARGDVLDATRILENSPRYKKWLEAIGADSAAGKDIARLGIIEWLSGADQEEQ